MHRFVAVAVQEKLLAWRDVKVRYKQTIIGVAWAVVQPVCTMVVFSLFFGRLVGVPSDGLPYPIFAYCALLPWQLFAHALTMSSTSLVANERLVTKVYFPRVLIPLASVVSGVVDFGVSLLALAVVMGWYGISPTWTILATPLLVLFAVATALAVGLWLSAPWGQLDSVRYIPRQELFTGLLVYDSFTIYFRTILLLFAVLFASANFCCHSMHRVVRSLIWVCIPATTSW
jgi:ABC-type polysaccharide/polyol phosphate export permease